MSILKEAQHMAGWDFAFSKTILPVGILTAIAIVAGVVFVAMYSIPPHWLLIVSAPMGICFFMVTPFVYLYARTNKVLVRNALTHIIEFEEGCLKIYDESTTTISKKLEEALQQGHEMLNRICSDTVRGVIAAQATLTRLAIDRLEQQLKNATANDRVRREKYFLEIEAAVRTFTAQLAELSEERINYIFEQTADDRAKTVQKESYALEKRLRAIYAQSQLRLEAQYKKSEMRRDEARKALEGLQ